MIQLKEEIIFSITIETSRRNPRELEYVTRMERAYRQRLHHLARRYWFRSTRKRARSRFFRLLPAVSITLGSLILTNTLWPIMSYLVFTSPDLQRQRLVSALPDVSVVRQSATVPVAQAATADELKPRVIKDDLDYTDLSNWFPAEAVAAESFEDTAHETEKEYVIDIPSLDIENAVVQVGGTDLDENLIQYPGTADPGELGAPVIFGHSVLRQFYNPSLKNPRRYMSIFSKIMTMKPGEKIYVEYDNIRYTYSVVKKVEVKPEDLYILEQQYDAKQLKLVTCVPEGTYLRRGVVLAQLEEIE